MTTLETAVGKVKIVEIQGGKGFVKRLFDLGLFPGQVVEVISRGPPVVLRVNDTEIAVGRGVARKIVVEAVNA